MASADLDAEVRRGDPDRWLASRFIADREARESVIALYALDHQLARAEALAANPLAAAIRLTWWRDAVASGAGLAHPLVQALHARGLGREALAAIIEARIEAIGQAMDDAETAPRWARQVEGALAVLAGQVLGARPQEEAAIAAAGVVWGLVILRRSGRAAGGAIDAALSQCLSGASEACRALPPAVFPAALCATLARAETGSRRVGGIVKRLRLARAALTGRL